MEGMKMKRNSAKTKDKRRRRGYGPRLLMTDTEYAAVRRMAAYRGRSLCSYIRERVLAHSLASNYSAAEVNRVTNAGKRFNHFVHGLHIDPTIIVGARRPGLCHYDDVMTELSIIEKTLRQTPRKTWRPAHRTVGKGDGMRKDRGYIRCTPEERARIKEQAKAAGLTQAAFVRGVVLNRPIGKTSHWVMTNQLERIENNLQQLLHLRGWTWSYAGGQRINLLIRDIDRRIRELTSGKKRNDLDQ